jgi:hypothetical protein
MRVCCGHHVTATEPLPSNGRLQNRFVATAVTPGFTTLAFNRHGTILLLLRYWDPLLLHWSSTGIVTQRSNPDIQRVVSGITLVSIMVVQDFRPI